MNDIQALTEAILREARAEAEAHLHAEEEKTARETAEAERLLAEQLEEKKALLAQQSRERVEAALRRRQSALQKERARYRQALLDRLFAEAEDALSSLPAEEFRAFFHRAIAPLPLKGIFTLHVGAKSAERFTEADWAALTVKEDGFSVVPSRRTIPGAGGLVLEQSPLEYSFLFRELLGDVKSRDGSGLLKQLLG